jgi:hypothetical protein
MSELKINELLCFWGNRKDNYYKAVIKGPSQQFRPFQSDPGNTIFMVLSHPFHHHKQCNKGNHDYGKYVGALKQ